MSENHYSSKILAYTILPNVSKNLPGPLWYTLKNGTQDIPYLVGVVSFGAEAGCAEGPGVYARVSHVINWIKQNMDDTYTCP